MTEYDLIANVNTKGVPKATQDLRKFELAAGRAEKSVFALANSTKAIKGLAGLSTAVVGATAALGKFTLAQAQAFDDLNDLALAADININAFISLAGAWKTVGVSSEQTSTILKSTEKAMLQLETTGKGKLAKTLDLLAGRTNLTTESFKGLSGPQALQLVTNEMQRANIPMVQQVAIMDQMAKGASKLIPLLKDNAAVQKQMQVQISKFSGGATIDPEEAARLTDLADAWDNFKTGMGIAAMDFAAHTAPLMIDALTKIADKTRDIMTGFEKIGTWIDSRSGIPSTTQGIAVKTQANKDRIQELKNAPFSGTMKQYEETKGKEIKKLEEENKQLEIQKGRLEDIERIKSGSAKLTKKQMEDYQKELGKLESSLANLQKQQREIEQRGSNLPKDLAISAITGTAIAYSGTKGLGSYAPELSKYAEAASIEAQRVSNARTKQAKLLEAMTKKDMADAKLSGAAREYDIMVGGAAPDSAIERQKAFSRKIRNEALKKAAKSGAMKSVATGAKILGGPVGTAIAVTTGAGAALETYDTLSKDRAANEDAIAKVQAQIESIRGLLGASPTPTGKGNGSGDGGTAKPKYKFGLKEAFQQATDATEEFNARMEELYQENIQILDSAMNTRYTMYREDYDNIEKAYKDEVKAIEDAKQKGLLSTEKYNRKIHDAEAQHSRDLENLSMQMYRTKTHFDDLLYGDAISTRISQVKEQYMDEQNALRDYYDKRYDIANMGELQIIEMKKKYAEDEKKLKEKQAQDIKQVQVDALVSELYSIESMSSAVSGAFDSMYSRMHDAREKAGKKDTDSMVRSWRIGKSLALASAGLSVAAAGAQVLASPTSIDLPTKLANYAALVGAGANMIGTIAGMEWTPPRSQGGMMNKGKPYLVGEKGPELVIPNSNSRIASTSDTMGMMGRQMPNITIVNNTSGRIDKVEQRQIGVNDVMLIVKETLKSEVLQPSSQFNKNFDKTRNSNRRV